jgi:hypothetical protein
MRGSFILGYGEDEFMFKWVIVLILLIGNVCAVSEHVITLPKCTDPNVIMDLQKMLNSYRYTKSYDDMDFNCVDLTTACVQFLIKNGYNASIMAYIPKGNNVTGHCYPIVNVKNKWIAIETCHKNMVNRKLGVIAYESKYNYLTGHFINNTTELNEFDGGPDPVYTGDLTRFIVKN